MARARNIKPGFFTNDVLAECTPLARLLFAGLWLHADREGRLEDRPRKIKAEILPYDSCDADQLLGELQTHGFIVRYEHQGSRYIQVTNFGKHQNPHVKESPSEIPAPDEHGASPVLAPETPERAGLNPSSLIPQPESGIPQPEPTAPAEPPPPAKRSRPRPADWADDFAAIWAAYPRKPGMSRSNTEKVFAARVAEGANIANMLAGVQAYAAYVVAMGTEPQYIKAPETFFGPGKHWESDWTPPVRAAPAAAAPQQLTKAGQATARNMEAWLERKRQEASNA